ncbi:activator-dependent family glycosyltransferase [Streptomyces alboflavus]|nr:activator-dependent family glycosyltransferase [Streptomyces alboflavus]
MRVLFVTFPWRTHFHAVVPLAWSLNTAGHEVRVASTPELTDVITGSGLTAVPVGPVESVLTKLEGLTDSEHRKRAEDLAERGDLLVDFAENREEELTWERLRWLYRFFSETLRTMNDSMVEDLVEYSRWWQPDLVVWDWMSYAGPIAATAVGAANARMPIGLDVEGRMRRHYLRLRAQQPETEREDPVGEWLAGWAKKYGKPFSEEMVTGHFSVDQVLGSMRVEQKVPHVDNRYTAYNGPSVAAEWTRRDPEKRRVLATFGLSLEQTAKQQALSGEQLQAMLDSLADLDIELVLTLPEQLERELDRVPDNTKIVPFVPVHVILPSCAAVIHHGGIPVWLDAMAHGVPQVMVSRVVPDISERGPRLERAGAGLWYPVDAEGDGHLMEKMGGAAPEAVGAWIRESLVRVLDEPEFLAAAGRLREEALAQPTPNDAVPELERLVELHRSR